jgi:hypothetical protein
MRPLSPRGLIAAVCVVALALACGCGAGGPRGVKVKGKLVKNGQPVSVDLPPGKPLPPGESARMKVWFYPVKADNEVIVDAGGGVTALGGEPATVESDGSFWLTGSKGTGIPAGKYRIVVTHTDPFTGKDLLKGAYSEAGSKVTRDVTGEQEIVIDLAKPQG